MGKLNPKGMSDLTTERVKKSEALRKLTAIPFDLSNIEQQQALKKHLDAFELQVNQMYLYQAMSTGIKTWFGSFVVGRFLPIPDFANYFLSAFLYLGTAAYILERFSMTDFYEQLQEMKAIYNWCLKNNNESYTSDTDNTKNLNTPDIQRFIKLLAPLCETEFMIAWPKEVVRTGETANALSKTLSAGYSAIASTCSLFFRSTAPTIDQNRIRDLKINVETRGLDVGVFNGLEQATRYFATNAQFRELLTTQLTRPLDIVKQLIPGSIIETFHPKMA